METRSRRPAAGNVWKSDWVCQWSEEIYRQLLESVFDNNLIDRSDVTISLNAVEDIWVKGAASLVYDRQFSDYTSELMGFSGEG